MYLRRTMKWGVVFAVCACILIAGSGYCRDDLQLRMIKIVNGNGASICATARSALSPDGRMSFDPKTNTLVVADRPEYIPHIEELVNTLDIKVPVVEVEVRITEVNSEFVEKAGIRSSQIIFTQGSFETVRALLNSRTGVFIKSEMTITTASGEPAQIQVSREALFGAAAAGSRASAGVYAERKDAGDFLEVLPFVNPDNTVTVKLRPGSSSVQDDAQPSEISALTQVTLHSQDTLAIGRVDTMSDKSQRRTMLFLSARLIYQ